MWITWKKYINKYKDEKSQNTKTLKEYKEQELAPWKGLSVWIAWMEGHEERRGGQAGYGYQVTKSFLIFLIQYLFGKGKRKAEKNQRYFIELHK